MDHSNKCADRRTFGGLLTEAEENVALSKKHILRQREIIAEMEQQGLDTQEARHRLALFEDLQEINVRNAGRLRSALKGA